VLKRRHTASLFVVACLGLIPFAAHADEDVDPNFVAKTNILSTAAVATWGVLTWDYGTRSPHFRSEEWFSDSTSYGGADKLGHMYMAYTLTHAYAELYGAHGATPQREAVSGALSAAGVMGLMEIGDSFSDFGFSYQDFIMNLAGAAVGYYALTHEGFRRRVDLRVEYLPTFTKGDFFTDYDGLKYLVAVKLDGFDVTRSTPLALLELHAGYYTRGYDLDRIEGPVRILYAGVGINVPALLRRWNAPQWATFFQYVQIPYTDVVTEHKVISNF